jgi:hypothetical protein
MPYFYYQADTATVLPPCGSTWVSEFRVYSSLLDMGLDERRIYAHYKTLSAIKVKSIMDQTDATKNRRKTPLIELALAQCRRACAGGQLSDPKSGSWAGLGWLYPEGPISPLMCVKLQHHPAQRPRHATAKEPSLHAVVFTHHAEVHPIIQRALRERKYTVCCGFTGSTKVDERHATIRSFQASADASVEAVVGGGGGGRGGGGGAPEQKRAKREAKVFVATMKVGNVGITLTAATRVYLFEPRASTRRQSCRLPAGVRRRPPCAPFQRFLPVRTRAPTQPTPPCRSPPARTDQGRAGEATRLSRHDRGRHSRTARETQGRRPRHLRRPLAQRGRRAHLQQVVGPVVGNTSGKSRF